MSKIKVGSRVKFKQKKVPLDGLPEIVTVKSIDRDGWVKLEEGSEISDSLISIGWLELVEEGKN